MESGTNTEQQKDTHNLVHHGRTDWTSNDTNVVWCPFCFGGRGMDESDAKRSVERVEKEAYG